MVTCPEQQEEIPVQQGCLGDDKLSCFCTELHAVDTAWQTDRQRVIRLPESLKQGKF